MNDHTAPYAALDPACIFDALDSVGARSDGRLLALNSYENRVYHGIKERLFCVKNYRCRPL